MITPWEIYWVMQLDSIGASLTFATVALSVIAGVALFAGALMTDRGCFPSDAQDAAWARVTKLAKRLGVAALVLLVANGFIPSTKTAAAMIVIPAVTNNQAIQREAGDLYGIAKDALRELAKPKQEASK